ncbi:DUF2520 domain-containing protein [Rhodobacteraceae bacterium SC52]|nr:DUF2520 domain-containing protein [Rhodobacteraceae bacterium SC52]
MQQVNIIGPGRVGRTLMALVSGAPDYEVGDVYSATPASAIAATAAIGTGRAVSHLKDMGPADIWILSVPDDQIGHVAQDLAQHLDSAAPPRVAMHCSGFLPSSVLAPLRDLGWPIASCHPVLSFADPLIAKQQFPGTCCAIEGTEDAVPVVTELVAAIEGIPFTINADNKAIYHAAAVFSNNFTTVLQAIAREAWAESGVPDDIARKLGDTLLRGTSESVARLGPAGALTGPAARGDTSVLHVQEEKVADWHPDAAQLYAMLSQMARRLKEHGTTQTQD